MHNAFLLPVLTLSLLTLPLAAQVPQALNYQGRVTVNGAAFTGTGQFLFALVDGEGTAHWSSHASATTPVSVLNGLYSVRLGDTTLPNMAAVPSAIFSNADLRLRVLFNDGVNGLQILSPDQRLAPVGYAHRAARADSVPASAIAADSIQPSHLAHTLQTGAAGNIASIPATGGVFSVTFPQPFETPPVVTMDGLTVPAASVTGTGFTLTIPPRDLVVDDGTPAAGNTGEVREAMLVGGFPAIAYIDTVSGDVNFVRATNAQGSEWSAPVLAAAVPGANAAQHLSLAIVEGNPAIAYWISSGSTVAWSVNYVRATNATGTTWGAPVTAAALNNRTVQRCVLKTAVVSPGTVRPFIGYNLNGGNGFTNVHVIKGDTAEGTTWGGQQTLDPALNGVAVTPHFDLEEITGGLLVIYSDPANLAIKAIQSTSLAGNTWGTPRFIGTDRQALDVDLFPTGGGLSVCWREGDLVYASEVPSAPFSVTPNLVCQTGQPSAVVMGDVPEVLFSTATELFSIRAADDGGNTWQAPRLVQAQTDASEARPAGVRLADGTVLAVFHSALNGGQVRVSGTHTPFASQWQAALPAPVVASAVAEGSITWQSLAPDFFGTRLRTDGTGSFATGDRAAALGTASWAGGQNTLASGNFALAMGIGTTAGGYAATALGSNTTASDSAATALGQGTAASGYSATAMGQGSTASGDIATAMGHQSTASGQYATAMGTETTASGQSSTAMGAFTLASSSSATAMGHSTTARGSYTTAMGRGSEASGFAATAMGQYTAASGHNSTAMGANTTASGEYATAIGSDSVASGLTSTAMGALTDATGEYATAMGFETTASGHSSTAMGHSNTASGDSSTTMGQSNEASAPASIAMGFETTASGFSSTAMGYQTTASGFYSAAMGHASRAETYGEVSLGFYPLANTGDVNSRVFTDVLLEVGNGVSGTPSNALTIFKDGRMGLDNADTDALVTHLLTLPNINSATNGRGIANAWATYSDSRIKTEQRPISYGLREIMRLQPRAYTQHSGSVEHGIFKCEDDTGGSVQTIGFIAQEVEQVIPEAVQKPDDPANQLYGMDYEKLIPVLVKATQELKSENDTLKAHLAAMQQRLEKLERPARGRK